MSEEWIIRVEGKEYGPVDLATLKEWKSEGRVLPGNDARPAEAQTWSKASMIPGLFDGERPVIHKTEPPPLPPPGLTKPVSTRPILTETLRIYTRGFFKFLGLTM